jgi:hypothetical protein
MGESLADRPLTHPHPDRLAPSHPAYGAILEAHADALRRQAPMYVDPDSGLSVLTATYLADRGTCCAKGCRHCPYLD